MWEWKWGEEICWRLARLSRLSLQPLSDEREGFDWWNLFSLRQTRVGKVTRPAGEFEEWGKMERESTRERNGEVSRVEIMDIRRSRRWLSASGATLTDGKQHSWLPWKHWGFYFIHNNKAMFQYQVIWRHQFISSPHVFSSRRHFHIRQVDASVLGSAHSRIE